MSYEFDAEGKKKTNFTQYAKQQEETRAALAAPDGSRRASAGSLADDPVNHIPTYQSSANSSGKDLTSEGSAPLRRSKIQQRARRPSQVGRVYEQPELPPAEFIEDSTNTEPVPVNASAQRSSVPRASMEHQA